MPGTIVLTSDGGTGAPAQIATAAAQATMETDMEALVTGTVSTAYATSLTLHAAGAATTSDAVVDVIAADATNVFHHIKIVNDSAVDGFFSINESTWFRLPDACAMVLDGVKITNKKVQIKRIAGDVRFLASTIVSEFKPSTGQSWNPGLGGLSQSPRKPWDPQWRQLV